MILSVIDCNKKLNKIEFILKIISLTFRSNKLNSNQLCRNNRKNTYLKIILKFTHLFYFFLIFYILEKKYDLNNQLSYQLLMLVFTQVLYKSLFLDFIENLLIITNHFFTKYFSKYSNSFDNLISLILPAIVFTPSADIKIINLFKKLILKSVNLGKKKFYKFEIIEITNLFYFKTFFNRFLFNYIFYSIKILELSNNHNILKNRISDLNYNFFFMKTKLKHIMFKTCTKIWIQNQFHIYNTHIRKFIKKKISI